MNRAFIPLTAASLALAAASTMVLAHEAHQADGARTPPPTRHAAAVAPEQQPWGIAGRPKAVKRTIDITMADDMTFMPAVIEVRQGDTVRLRLHNRGKEMHEFVLGTTTEIEAHAAMMKKFPNMEHDNPWMVHVPPGRSGAVVWTFNRAGDFDYACLIKDHYELGMAGRVRVRVLPVAGKH